MLSQIRALHHRGLNAAAEPELQHALPPFIRQIVKFTSATENLISAADLKYIFKLYPAKRNTASQQTFLLYIFALNLSMSILI